DGHGLHGHSDGPFIVNDVLNCTHCARSYPVADGIVRLLDSGELDQVSRTNLEVFDRNASIYGYKDETSDVSLMEMEPTLAALSPFQGMRIVEFGCGSGRYTVRLAPTAEIIVAVDYSLGVLRQLASRADPAWALALVQADCCTPVVAAASF